MSEHWLQHAHGRIVAGDSEPDVLADYGWVQITADEREAVEWFAEVRKPLTRLTQSHNREKYKATLRKLLERLK
jgi:hypothetical protein